MQRSFYIAYFITIGLHLTYGLVMLIRYLRVRNKAGQLWPREE